jgi:hypothetical protein
MSVGYPCIRDYSRRKGLWKNQSELNIREICGLWGQSTSTDNILTFHTTKKAAQINGTALC